MKVSNDKIENSQAFLTIEMEPAEVEESMDMAYHRLVKRARIPGFRKGKAPRAILESYLGKESLFEEAINNLAPEAYEKAIKEQEIEAFAPPQIEVAQTEPLIFKAVVPLRPEVKLGDYQQIQVKPEPVEVNESNVDEVIEQLRHQHATWETVERPVDFNDLVVMDIESSIEDTPFIDQKGAQYQVISGNTFPAPGFAEQLTGMKKNEEKEFKLKLPPDVPREELVGKEPWFKVQVNEIKQEMLPELNDEFVRVVNPDLDNLDALRETVSSELKLRAEGKAKAEFEEKVIDALVELSEVEFPPILVEAEIHRILEQRFQRGNQELEEYLGSINKTEEELHEELRPLATQRATRFLVLGKVADEEKVEISDAEIDTEIENMTQNAADDNKDKLKKALNTSQVRESIGQTLLTRKTVQRLVEMVEGTEEIKPIEKEAEK